MSNIDFLLAQPTNRCSKTPDSFPNSSDRTGAPAAFVKMVSAQLSERESATSQLGDQKNNFAIARVNRSAAFKYVFVVVCANPVHSDLLGST